MAAQDQDIARCILILLEKINQLKQPIFHLGEVLPSDIVFTSDGALLLKQLIGLQ